MVLWFAGTAVLAVWLVFHDPLFDYRLLLVGVLAPDLVDVWFGGSAVLHSVTGVAAVLVVVVLSTIGHRPLRKRLLAVPIGMFLHLIFDGAFSNTDAFWWPFSGASLGDTPLPVADRGPWNLLLELAGLALVWWEVRRFGLTDPERRRQFWRGGELVPC